MSVLCTVLNSSSDKGVVVSLHLGSPPKAVGEASLLDLVMFLSDSEHSSAVGKKEWICCGLHCGTANTTKQAAHSRGASDTEGGGRVVLVVGRSVSTRYTSPARARTVTTYGFCVVFRLSQLVTSPYGGTGAFAFLVAWFPSRW